MILLAITTDGRRDCIEQTIPSLLERVQGIDGPRLIFDDSGDAEYQAWLRETFGPQGFEVSGSPRRLGQDWALTRAWKDLAKPRFRAHPWVFWSEDDFLFERDVDLADLLAVLKERPHLRQMALLRQPWFPGEVKAGGIVERGPAEYKRVTEDGREWLDHRLWWTLNPNLFPRSLCELTRPVGKRHEWNFSRQLCEDESARFGIWGDGNGAEPWVKHIGEQRVGCGY